MSEILENKTKIETDEIDLIEVFRKIRDGRKTIFKWMVIFFVIGIIIVIASPKEYKSEVTLLVETDSKFGGMSGLLQQFGGLAGVNIGNENESSLNQKLYPEIIRSTPFLLKLMNIKIQEGKYKNLTVENFLTDSRPTFFNLVGEYTFGLPSKILNIFRKNSDRQISSINGGGSILYLNQKKLDISEDLSNRILIKNSEKTNTLILSVKMQDPKIASVVVDSLIILLKNYIIEYRTSKAINDFNFVLGRYNEAKNKYLYAQKMLAEYRDKNKNLISSFVKTDEDRLVSEFNLAFNIYTTLSQHLEQARMKVQENTPVFKVMNPPIFPLHKSEPKTILILLAMCLLGSLFGFLRWFLTDF